MSNFKLCVSLGKEVEIVENSNSQQKKIRIRCVECLNYIDAILCVNGGIRANCPICKSIIFTKQHSDKEKHIRVIKNK